MKRVAVITFAGMLGVMALSCRPKAGIAVTETNCIQAEHDLLTMDLARPLLPGKRWVYHYSISDSCFVKKEDAYSRHFPKVYIFEACEKDDRMPDVLQKLTNFSKLCYRTYWRENGGKIMQNDSTLIDEYYVFGHDLSHSLEIINYGQHDKGVFYIRHLTSDTLVTEASEGYYSAKDKTHHLVQHVYVAE